MAIFNSYVSLPEGNDLSWLAGNSWFIDFLDDVPVTMRIFSPWPCFPEGVYPSTRLTVPESVEMLMCGTKNEAFDVRLGEINCNSKDRCGFVWFWRKTPGLAHVFPTEIATCGIPHVWSHSLTHDSILISARGVGNNLQGLPPLNIAERSLKKHVHLWDGSVACSGLHQRWDRCHQTRLENPLWMKVLPSGKLTVCYWKLP